MGIVNIAIVLIMVVCALIGMLAGLINGFIKSKSWAIELLISGTISIALSALISSKVSNTTVSAVLSLCIALILICANIFAFGIFRILVDKHIELHRQKELFAQHDEIEENKSEMLLAVGAQDDKQFKKLSKRKFRQSAGRWGVVDRVLGGAVHCLNGLLFAGILCAVALMMLDFSRLTGVNGKLEKLFASVYSNGIWRFLKSYIFDFLIILLVMASIKSGYKSGMFSSLWSLTVIGLITLTAIMAFSISFHVDDFIYVAQMLKKRFEEIMPDTMILFERLGISTLSICKGIIGFCLFLLLQVGVVLIVVFVPSFVADARDSAIFRRIDGVLGAFIITVFMCAFLLLVGAVINCIYELPIMNIFNLYFVKSGIATYFYDKNLLNLFGLLNNLPIKGWLS